MDKESLKYIINNSDTIFEEQLQIQARQRICEQISRRLKGIEFEKPKNNPVNEVIEDEIVDATKLPALFLQEIENCFGLEIFANQKTLQDDQEKETNQTKESIGQPEKCTEEKKNESEKSVVESSKVNNENTKELIAPTTALSSFESVRSTLESSNVTKETPKESITTDKAVNKKSYEFSQNSEISIQKYNHKDQVVLVKKTTENLENSLQKDYEVDEVVLAKETTENPHGIDNEKDKVVLAKKTNENTENAQQKDKEKDQVVLAKEVELSKIKRKSSGEDKLDEEPIKKPKETVKSDNKGNESVKENTEKETEPKDMAKQRSSDLMARLKVAEEFNQRLNSNSLLNNDNKKDKKSPQKDNSPDHELVRSPVLDCLEVEIKDEPVFVCSTSPMPTVVISSSDEEDYAENDDDNDDDDDDDEEDGDEDVKTDSDSNSCSSFSKSHYNEELQSGVVINTFEKLILPQLPQQMIERYRKNHSATLYTRLQFIFGVVTSSKHNPQVFSNTEISKIQNNLKETNNRIAIEFLLKEIVNVAASQRGKEEQNGANGITVAKNAESAEVIHQRNQVDVSPTPPPLPVSQNVPLSMQCLRQQPFNLPSIQFGMESSMPRLQLGSCYSLLANGETNTESSYGQDSITQSLLEIDRRLLEYQNRRSFIDEIIMKFQKEKSDLEMLTLELHSRKFLILNTVVTKNPAGGTPSQAATTPTVTPTNSPSPGLESTTTELSLPSSPPVASKPSKEVNRRKKSKRNARRKLRSENEQQETESISIPKPINRIKEDPENEDISLAANSHPPVKKLRITKSNLSQQQQPLAIIPPLPPPPPPPEPIVSSMSIVPPLPPPPTLPDSIANISYSHPNRRESNSDFDYIPSGRLHSISYPITHIRIYKIYIIASSEDGDIYMFNIKNHKLERQITKHSEAITNMYLCKKDSYLYTTSLDGFLKKSSLENLERVMQTVYFKEPLQSIDLAWDLAFIGSRWGNLFTFDVMTNKVMESPLLSTGQSIIAVKATKEGPRKIVILGCKGNFVYMHDATTGLLLRRLTLPNDLNVYSLLLNDGHVYCGTQKNEIFKFDFASGNLVDKVSCGNGAVSMVAYGERYLLVGCYDGYIYVLDKLGCNQMGRFEGAGRMVLALAIAGDKVVTSSKDKSLVVLEIPQQMINTEH
ncbi:uncharacterized protein LOC6647322 [Drosophila willistoni]|uniref:uncharacterized protein LOC6647322 n=1 Tax=Drosophila willistoni TaxID=7260 RepID=UPI001F07B36F|nr:uncharacterized protein LOC6647322 [Drosophila willistoni]